MESGTIKMNPKKESAMKRLSSLVIVSLLTLSLSACAGLSRQHETHAVKCPACGYEFEVPMGGD